MLDGLPETARSRLLRRAQPDWLEPMKATLTEDRFSDPDWIFEPKLDGERCLAIRSGGRSRLLSRNRKELNGTYPELVAALDEQPAGDFIADGEIVAFEGGLTSFARLQQRMQLADPSERPRRNVAVYLYLFDLLYLDGHLLTRLSLVHRKQLLRDALRFGGKVRLQPYRREDGLGYYREACSKGWEGLIAKRAGAPYRHARSRDWLKFKCVAEQEFVIGGFTDPGGTRTGFGALLVGYYEGDRLRYAGKVGTGYDREVLERLGGSLRALEQDRSPFVDSDERGRGVHWTRPELVAEIGFTEMTDDGRLRHPRYLGVRRDKDPREVVLER